MDGETGPPRSQAEYIYIGGAGSALSSALYNPVWATQIPPPAAHLTNNSVFTTYIQYISLFSNVARTASPVSASVTVQRGGC